MPFANASAVSTPALPENQRAIARQAILDASLSVVGYELFDRSIRANEHTASSDAELLFNALTLAAGDQPGTHKTLFINCTHESLDNGHLDLVEADHMVLEIPPLQLSQVDRVADSLPGLQEARRRGFRLAFNYSILTRSYASWLPLASFIKFDVSVLRPEAIPNFVELARKRSSAQLIAEKVETRAQYESLRALGITLFQGYWFAVPVLVQGHKLRPAQTVILQLVDMVRKQASTDEIENLLKHDPALSFNLLRFINSAAFGMRSQVTSFKHAVMLLGYRRLFKWAALLLTTSSAGDTPPAVGMTAIIRGRLMELLAEQLGLSESMDDAFVTGVFSLLDVMLDQPMAAALSAIALPADVCAALLHQGGALAPLLELTVACESGAGTEFTRHAGALGLTNQQVNQAHLQALAWAEWMSPAD